MSRHSPIDKAFAAEAAGLAQYVTQTYRPEDAVLADVRKRAVAANMPPIHVSPYDGLILEVLARAAGARTIVEIGTLAGYSGICLARALPPGGVLHTFEFSPLHAKVARESFTQAGVADKVEIHVGAALENLKKVEHLASIDLVFIDADKPNYPNYLNWAAKYLRPGGLVLADNAFAWGLLALPADAPQLAKETERTARAAIDSVNRTLGDPAGPFRGAMLPTGEGLAMGVKRG